MLVPRGGSNTLTGGGRTNTWDGQNRLTQCVFNGTTTTHTYGSDGLRRRTVEGATTTDYVLDGQGVVRTLVNNVVDRTYLHGTRGPEYERVGANDPVWYLYDGLGSVLGTVDKNGTVVSTRKYDVYGAVRASTGPSGTKHKFVGSLGHPSDDETGLVYMQARYYDPVIGRFASEDPSKDGPNWFAYCSNDPVNCIDPDGRYSRPVRARFWTAGTMMVLVALLAIEAGGACKSAIAACRAYSFSGSASLIAGFLFGQASLGMELGPSGNQLKELAGQFTGGLAAAIVGIITFGKVSDNVARVGWHGSRLSV